MNNRSSDTLDKYIRKIERKKRRRRTAILAVFCISISVLASSIGFFLGMVTSSEHQITEQDKLESTADVARSEAVTQYTSEINVNGFDKAQAASHARVAANKVREAEEYQRKHGGTEQSSQTETKKQEEKGTIQISLEYKDYRAILLQAGFGDENELHDQPEVSVVDEPDSGEVVYFDVSYINFDVVPITVTAPEEEDILFELKETITNNVFMALYVQAGDTVTVNIPAVRAEAWITGGKVWRGYDHNFKHSVWHGKGEAVDHQNGSVTYVVTNAQDYWTPKK